MYDITILTDPRYLYADKNDPYVSNVILEDQYIIDALISEGLKVTRMAWDSPDFDWSTTRFALFRAVWDYFDRIDEFRTWYKKASKATTFINSKTLIEWNIDKHYLQELFLKGVNIPKTLFIESGDNSSLIHAFRKLKNQGVNEDYFVLKPCIAAGARHTYKIHISETEQYEPIFKRLIAKEAMMVQEFQHNVVKTGEVSMMLFGDEFTHAILKVAKTGDFRVQDDYGGSVNLYNASEEEIAFAKKVVDATPGTPDYARVDIFRDNDGALALAELEIFEPELWFRHHPEAGTVFVNKLKARYFS